MTLQQALHDTQQRLAKSGVPDPEREAWILLSTLLHQPRAWVMAHPDAYLTPSQYRKLLGWLRRRAQREPLPYITHRRWFYGLELVIQRGVLIPRPETELLVERFLEWARLESTLPKGTRSTLIDVGTGSGAIAVACLTHAPDWQGIGVDRSVRALRVAERNRRKFGLQDRLLLAQMDWLSAIHPESVHAMLSNPPYVLPDEWDRLQPEITRWEPKRALLVPQDNPLLPYQTLAQQAMQVLTRDGLLLVETSPRLADSVCNLLKDWGYRQVRVHADLAGQPRAVEGRK